MRKRFVPGLVVFGLVLAAPVVRAADDPAVVVRVQSIDALLDNIKYIAGLADRAEEARQFEGLIKARAGAKGLEGIDTKRPLGLYGNIGAAGIDSTVVILVPIADEKAFISLLENLNLKPEKGNDGVYTVTPENSPVPVYFRFANRYAYATVADKANIDQSKLLAPDKVLAGGQGAASALFRVDQIPDNLKQIALGQLELQLANAKEKKDPKETKAQQELREQTLDLVFSRLTAVIREGSNVTAQLNVDQKAETLTLELSLAGQPGSSLAKEIAELGGGRSQFGGLLQNDAAVNFLVHGTVPESVRKAFLSGFQEALRQSLEKEQNATKRQQAEVLAKALEPSLKAGELDAALTMRGPSRGEHYTLVAAVKVKDGREIDKALRDIVKDLPADDRDKIKLDAETSGEVKIHRIEAKNLDAEAQRTLGRNPIYFAATGEALLIGAGVDGLAALKEALTVQPKAAPPMVFEVSLAKLAPAMAKDQKAAVPVAKKVFADGKDGDKIRVTVEGGKAVKARVELKSQVIKFLSELQKAGKEQ